MKREDLITRNKDILGGTPVFAGTRVPVRILLDQLQDGAPLDEFLEGFPTVTREHAQAVLKLLTDTLLAEKEERS